MGRELMRQLTAAGCSVAMCDVSHENMDETAELVRAAGDADISWYAADVGAAAEMDAFAAHVADHHGPSVNLLFNNAGIGGGGSLVNADPGEWTACSTCAGEACSTAPGRSCRCCSLPSAVTS